MKNSIRVQLLVSTFANVKQAMQWLNFLGNAIWCRVNKQCKSILWVCNNGSLPSLIRSPRLCFDWLKSINILTRFRNQTQTKMLHLIPTPYPNSDGYTDIDVRAWMIKFISQKTMDTIDYLFPKHCKWLRPIVTTPISAIGYWIQTLNDWCLWGFLSMNTVRRYPVYT